MRFKYVSGQFLEAVLYCWKHVCSVHLTCSVKDKNHLDFILDHFGIISKKLDHAMKSYTSLNSLEKMIIK